VAPARSARRNRGNPSSMVPGGTSPDLAGAAGARLKGRSGGRGIVGRSGGASRGSPPRGREDADGARAMINEESS
jgi:hypothetical protein